MRDGGKTGIAFFISISHTLPDDIKLKLGNYLEHFQTYRFHKNEHKLQEPLRFFLSYKYEE